jgi:murein L,D-transpeptidase YafK
MGNGSKALLVIVILIALCGAGLYAFWPQAYRLYESEMIRAQRIEHWSLAKAGQTLPGTPDLADLKGRLAAAGVSAGAPVLVRIFKREFELELWMKRDGRFVRFATYPICMWSGDLGPKIRTGDRQAPEGFYTVENSSLNPNSKYHRSFNLGFPNAFDRAHDRTGSFLMVHGHCLSVGCYAMTDPVIDEIWGLVTAALQGGQKRFQVQVFPFRMTERNMSLHAHDAAAPFWRQLKDGYDIFERTKEPPLVSVCQGRYEFRAQDSNSDGSAAIESACRGAGSST